MIYSLGIRKGFRGEKGPTVVPFYGWALASPYTVELSICPLSVFYDPGLPKEAKD